MITPENFPKRWVAYFDLLGFKNLIQKHDNFPELVLSIYNDVLSEINNSTNQTYKGMGLINYCWFSDTFLFWSKDNDGRSFSYLEQASRLFFTELLNCKIPVRGAISYESFYADTANSTYLGQALVEAYEYAEAQQWLNYVLTPAVYQSLTAIELDPLKRLKYSPISTFKEKVYPDQCSNYNIKEDRILAYTYSADDSMGNYIYHSLKNLRQKFQDNHKKITTKYDNSLSWLETQQRRWSNRYLSSL